MRTARRLEHKLEFLAILILDRTVKISFLNSEMLFSLAGNLNSLAIDGCVDRTLAERHMFTCTAQTTCVHGSRGLTSSSPNCVPKTFTRPRVMFRFALHSTLNASTCSLSPTSLVLHSSTSPTPDLLVHASIHPLQRSTAGWHFYGIPTSRRKRPISRRRLHKTFRSRFVSDFRTVPIKRTSELPRKMNRESICLGRSLWLAWVLCSEREEEGSADLRITDKEWLEEV